MLNLSRIGLFFGGVSVEHEVSLRSMKSVYNALDKKKFEPVLFAISKEGLFFTTSNMTIFEEKNSIDEVIEFLQPCNISDISNFNLDCAFSTLHGACGENGSFSGLFEILKIPYVGPSVLGAAIAMDKDVTKRLLEHGGLEVVPFKTMKSTKFDEESLKSMGFPCFIKAASLGSSVGVYKCVNIEEAVKAAKEVFELDSKLLIEKAVKGREIEVAVCGTEALIASLAGEVIPHHDFYSYQAKYLDENGASLAYPADNIDHELLKKLAIKACELLEIDSMARVDFFVTEDGHIFVNEINTLPGFTNISMYPKLFEVSGVPYSQLISNLIYDAKNRFEKNSRLQKTLYANLIA